VQEVSKMLIRILGHCDRAGNVVIESDVGVDSQLL
jgi:hypothetical protein